MASSSHIISPMQSQSQSQSQQQQHQHQPHSHPQPHQPQRKCGSSSSVATSAAFVLRLPDHQKELHQFIWQLFDDGMHTDCELSLDDGQYIRAHKLILSAFSPYFRQLLTRVSSAAHHTSGSGNSHYPVIIVKDVLYDDLRSLVEFMYRGQVTVADDRLPQVLKCAKQLKVRGLYENNTVNGNAHHYEYQPHVNHRNHVLSSQTSIHQKPVESVEMCNKIACNNASCNTNNNNTNNINTVNHVNHNNNSNTSTVNHINNANHVNTTTNHVNNNNSNNNNCKEVNMVEVKKPKAEPIPSSVYASPDRVIATNGRNDYVAEWLTKKLNPPNSFVNPITIPSLQQKIALDLSKSQSRHLSVPDHCLPPMASSSPYHYLHPGLFRSTSVDETRLTANMVQMNEKRKAASSLDGHLDNDTKAGSDENASFNNGDDLSTGSKDKKRNLNIFHAAKYRNRKKQQLDALFQEEIELQKQTIMSKMQIEKLESMILTLIWQQTKRSIDSNAQTVFTCPVCGNVQKEVSRLRSHINMLHNDTEALMKFLMLQRSPHQSTLQSTTTSVITTSTTMPSNSNNNNNNSSNSCGNSVPFHINITNNNNSNNNTIINNTNSNNNNNNSS